MQRQIRWRALAVVLAVIASILVVASPASASDFVSSTDQHYVDECGQYWPTRNTFETSVTPGGYSITWKLKLYQSEVDAGKCLKSRYQDDFVEIDLRVFGFVGQNNWDAYWIAGTNLPSAVHDVAQDDAAPNMTPGVTGIPVNLLVAEREYYLSIAWNNNTGISADPNVQQRVSFEWVPSRWASSIPEQYVCGSHFHTTQDNGWCIFGTTRAYVSHGYRSNTSVPLSGHQSFTYPPADDLGSAGGSDSSLGSPPPPPPPSRQMFLRGDSAVFAKDTLNHGDWVQETDPASIKAIAAAGKYQMVLNACNAVYAKDTLGMGGWVQETPCGGANKIAISNTGVQMLIDACGAVWARVGIGDGGWTREVDCGNADAIAVGGNTQMFIRGDKAVFAKTWVGDGGWQMQVGPANAIAIAADNTGMQAFIRWDGAVFAKRNHFGDGGWQMQVGPGNADAIAAGGGVLMFLRGDKALFAKTDISIDGGWQQQADPATVTAIAMGNSGRMMIRSNTNAIYAKDNLVNGDWHLQVGDGNAAAIAVG